MPVGRAALRILVGAVKYQFLGNLCNQLTYSGLLLDDHPHHWIDLPVAMLFYYLYLYLNFSGFCDMAIGVAALIGIPVPENFDNPFAARNVKDFWNRWHITLSVWMRDVVFSPLSKYLVGRMGIKLADHAVAITIFVVFLLIGIWHGVGWNYFWFACGLQSVGVVTVHYYTLFLKEGGSGREGLLRPTTKTGGFAEPAMAVTATFCYYAATLVPVCQHVCTNEGNLSGAGCLEHVGALMGRSGDLCCAVWGQQPDSPGRGGGAAFSFRSTRVAWRASVVVRSGFVAEGASLAREHPLVACLVHQASRAG